MTQFSSKFDILTNLNGVCLKIPKSIFPGESVKHAIVRLHLQGNTQAAIKQKYFVEVVELLMQSDILKMTTQFSLKYKKADHRNLQIQH